jgi:hypothetical protein
MLAIRGVDDDRTVGIVRRNASRKGPLLQGLECLTLLEFFIIRVWMS